MKKYILSLVFVFTFVLVGSMSTKIAFAKWVDTCGSLGGGGACKVGDCVGGDKLGIGGMWVPDSSCGTGGYLMVSDLNSGVGKLTWTQSGSGSTFNVTVYEKGGTVPTFVKTGIIGNTFDAPCLSSKGCEYTLSATNAFGTGVVSQRYPFTAKGTSPSSSDSSNSNGKLKALLIKMINEVPENMTQSEYILIMESIFDRWGNLVWDNESPGSSKSKFPRFCDYGEKPPCKPFKLTAGTTGSQNKSLQSTITSTFFIAGTALNSKMGFSNSVKCNLSTPKTTANPQLCITNTLAAGTVDMLSAMPIANASVVWTGDCSPIGGISYPGSRNKSCYIPPMYSNKSATATFSCNTGFKYFSLQGCVKTFPVLNSNTKIN